jgi:MFS superfamily sulfate permease-like transporter
MNIKYLLADIKASIVVTLVAIPLCLGIALASNAPIASGLIAGIIGGVIAGIISGSAISVSGPAAGLTVIVATGIATLGSFDQFAKAVILAGIIQLLIGVFRGGAIGNFIPSAVIKGMLAAIGLILIIKQSSYVLGLPKGSWDVSLINYKVTCISIYSFLCITIWDNYAQKISKYFQLVPSALVAVITSVLINNYFNLIANDQLVQIPQNIFNSFKLNTFGINWDLLKIGLTIAIVASLETLLCLDASDRLDPMSRTTNKNRELMAQGIGNFLCGIFGGLPITAVIVRTSANVSAGAKTKLSAIFHGLWLLLSVLLIPNLINQIPLATLAVILTLVGYKLTKPIFFLNMKARGLDQLFIFCITILAILTTDLLIGIGIGLLIAILFEYKNLRNKNSIIIQEKDMEIHLDIQKNLSFWHKQKIAKIIHKNNNAKEIRISGLKSKKIHIDISEYCDELSANKNNKITFN